MTTTTPTTTARMRALAVGGAALLILGTLTGCLPIPGMPGLPTSPDASTATSSELVDTEWSGVDSDGDSWTIGFQADGTIALTFQGDSYDDASDTWSHDGDEVTMHFAFDDGPVEMTGDYEGLDAPMETVGTYQGGDFTVTLTRD